MEQLEEGVLIAVEGLDGSGQSTQVALLASALRDTGVPVHATKEPTDGNIGGVVQAALRGEVAVDARTLQLLFAADRSHHVTTEIAPALADGQVVITDRYLFSSLAYGSMDLDRTWLETVNRTAPIPDATIFLDVPVETCMERLQERESLELFEDASTLKRVREAFTALDERYDSFRVVDGNRDVEAVHAAVMETLREALQEHPPILAHLDG